MKQTMDQPHRLVISVMMSGFMSIALTGVFTFLEFGISLDWLAAWGTGLLIAWPLATGLDLIFGAHVRNLAGQMSKAIPSRGTAPHS